MKKTANIKEMGLIIFISLMIFLVVMPIRAIYPTETFNPIWLSSLLSFVAYYFATYFLCKRYQLSVKPKKVLFLILLGLLILQVPFRIIDFKDTLISFPDFLISLLGILSGYISFIKRKSKWYLFIAGILLCAYMWFWGYNSYFHWMNHGTITGTVEMRLMDDIYMTDEHGSKTSLYQNRGKVLVFDCWYKGCGSCFTQLPHFQRLSNDFKQFENIRFYALGVKFDDSDNLFEILEKRNINLPVLTIERNDAAKLGVKVYPTIVVIDESSRIVFKGDLKNSKLFIEKYINKKKRD
jgi:thiol-disulfide isomerase/thioredoxin